MILPRTQQCHETYGFPATEALEMSLSDVLDDSSSFMADNMSHYSLQQPTGTASDGGADWFPRFDGPCFDLNDESYVTDSSTSTTITHPLAGHDGSHHRTDSLSSRRKRKLSAGLVRSLSLPCLPSTLDSSYSSSSETEPTTFLATTVGIITPSCKKRKTKMLTSQLAPLMSSRHNTSCGKEAHKSADWYIGCWVHDHNQKNPASPATTLTPKGQHLLLDCPFPHFSQGCTYY